MTDRTYREQTEAITADKTGRVIPRSALRRQVIKLDNALVEQPFRLQGDFLYADSNSTGVATVKLNNTSEDPIPFLGQASVEGMPFRDVFVSCAAQPGLVLNLWYAYQAKIRPPQATVAVTSNPITAAGSPQGADKVSSLNNAFGAFVVTPAAGAGNFSVVGVGNPNASGKRFYVDGFFWWVGAVTQIFCCLSTAAQVASSFAFRSRLNGGADASSLVRSGFVGAVPFGSVLDIDNADVVNKRQLVQFPNPYILDPNTGFYVVCQTANILLAVSLFGREY